MGELFCSSIVALLDGTFSSILLYGFLSRVRLRCSNIVILQCSLLLTLAIVLELLEL